jgi:RNA polymerase sigma factor (sigma-70 family)
VLFSRKPKDLYADAEVLRRLQDRDSRIQEAVWRSERSRLKAIALSILKSGEEADALVSDLFADFFYRHVNDVRSSRAIPAYLRVMAVRRARRQMGRARRQVPIEPDFPGEDPLEEKADRIDRNIWTRWLAECLSGLGRKARRILRMHYGHEMSYSVIAGELGGTKQAVGKMVKKSLEVLKRCLERHRLADAGE